MTAPRRPLPGVLLGGFVLLLVAVASWVLYALAARGENTSYRPHGAPPNHVRVHAGQTYWIAIPGGVDRVRQLGADPNSLNCTAAPAGQAATNLQVSPVVDAQNTETKFLNRIASFVPGFSGTVHVQCLGIGTVYLDNADGRPYDWSGVWLVLASLALVVGLALTISGLRLITAPAELPAGAEVAGRPSG